MEEEGEKRIVTGPKEHEITTSVDRLLDILKSQDKISMEEVAKKLSVSLDVVQSWVDFLVEEKIVGIEYKFTKPFIYLNVPEEEPEEEPEKKDDASFESIKQGFIRKAARKNIPKQNIESLWKNHLHQAIDSKKDFFFEEVARRKLPNADYLWKTYKSKIESM